MSRNRKVTRYRAGREVTLSPHLVRRRPIKPETRLQSLRKAATEVGAGFLVVLVALCAAVLYLALFCLGWAVFVYIVLSILNAFGVNTPL